MVVLNVKSLEEISTCWRRSPEKNYIMNSLKAFLQLKAFFLLYNHKWALPIILIVGWGMVWPMPRFSSHDILIYFPSWASKTAKRFSLSYKITKIHKNGLTMRRGRSSVKDWMFRPPLSLLTSKLQRSELKKNAFDPQKDFKLESLNFKLKQYQKRARHQKSLEYSVFIPKNCTV